ncbi:hypothetical protein P7K49_004157, partial [Saguinus oedipus]
MDDSLLLLVNQENPLPGELSLESSRSSSNTRTPSPWVQRPDCECGAEELEAWLPGGAGPPLAASIHSSLVAWLLQVAKGPGMEE